MTHSPEFVEDEIKAYLQNGEKKPAMYADVLGVTVDKFWKMVAIYREKHAAETWKEPEPLKTPIGKLIKGDVMEEDRKRRTNLTEPQREQVYEAYKAGGDVNNIAERFDISPNTVRNIYFKLSRQAKENPPTPAPVEKIVESVLANEDVSVFFEGEFMIFKLHKKHITRKLLEGVI